MKKERFITDFGQKLEARNIGTGQREQQWDVEQYAVWEDNEVIEVSGNLEYLKNKYGQDLIVARIKSNK